MPDISALSALSNDSNLVTGGTISATEHNTHRTNYRNLSNNLLSVVQDLENNFSSASEPTDKPSGKHWYDSGNDLIKERIAGVWKISLNEDNTVTVSNKTFSGFALAGDIISTATAIDWDLLDNDSSALSFDATGKSGLLSFDTTDDVEGVMMSGFLTVGAGINAFTAENDGNPFFKIGSSDLESFQIQPVFDSGTQSLDYVSISTKASSASANKGEIRFSVDEAYVSKLDDAGFALQEGYSLNASSGITALYNRNIVIAANGDSGASNSTTLAATIGHIALYDSAGLAYPFENITIAPTNWTNGFVGFSSATAGVILHMVIEGDKSDRNSAEIKVVTDYEAYRASIASTKAVYNDPNLFSLLPTSTTQFYSFLLENGLRDLNNYVLFFGGNGAGSTNTGVRRFSSIPINLGDFGIASQSAVDGDSFIASRNCRVRFAYKDFGTAAIGVAITKNGSQLSTSPISFSASMEVLAYGGTSTSAIGGDLAGITNMQKGDTLRAQKTPGSITNASNYNQHFVIEEI